MLSFSIGYGFKKIRRFRAKCVGCRLWGAACSVLARIIPQLDSPGDSSSNSTLKHA